jgi:hypothetical protein
MRRNDMIARGAMLNELHRDARRRGMKDGDRLELMAALAARPNESIWEHYLAVIGDRSTNEVALPDEAIGAH